MALDEMTIYGHDVTMKKVMVAELKSRLSEYLREVFAGETVVVMNRDRPVATLGPYREPGPLVRLRPPRPGAPAPRDLIMPPPLMTAIDAVDLLLEDRRR